MQNLQKEKAMETIGTFKISEPCHENWNNMTPETQGRFCASCSKCVFDFSSKSAKDIEKAYTEQGGDICGRVKVSQLVAARPAIRGKLDLRRYGLKSLQMFALALMAAFTFMFASPVSAQKDVVMGKMVYVAPAAKVEGRVTWDSGVKAGGIKVVMYRNGTLLASTTTDEKGRYEFNTRHQGEVEVIAEAGHGVSAHLVVSLNENKVALADLVLYDRRIMGGISFEPSEPLEPIQPIELIQPIEPIQPIELIQPIEPIQPIELIQPIEPIQPVVNEKLAILIAPVTPTEAETSDKMPSAINPDESLALGGFEVKVFPNPTADRVTMLVEKAGEADLQVSLVDIGGNTVYASKWTKFMDLSNTVDVTALPAGVYLLHLRSGTDSIVRRLLKL
jgi:hypothetical protein